MPDSAKIDLIGTFAVSTTQGRAPVPRTSLKLLAFLSLRGAPVSRSELASVLWPQYPERRARGNLRAAMWRLDPVSSRLLHGGDDTIGIRPGTVIDVIHLSHRCKTMLGRGRIDDELGQDPKLLEDLLPDVAEEWVELPRERWRQLRLHVLSRYSAQLCTESRPADAVVLLEQALVGAPRHEALRATAARACTLSAATSRTRGMPLATRTEPWRPESTATPNAAGTVEVHHPKEMSR